MSFCTWAASGGPPNSRAFMPMISPAGICFPAANTSAGGFGSTRPSTATIRLPGTPLGPAYLAKASSNCSTLAVRSAFTAPVPVPTPGELRKLLALLLRLVVGHRAVRQKDASALGDHALEQSLRQRRRHQQVHVHRARRL